eukprot:262294_1
MTVATNAMHRIQILTGIDDILKTYLQHPNITLTQHKCTMHTSNIIIKTQRSSINCNRNKQQRSIARDYVRLYVIDECREQGLDERCLVVDLLQTGKSYMMKRKWGSNDTCVIAARIKKLTLLLRVK